MYPVTLLLPARGYRVLGGYTGPLHAGGYRSGGYTLLLPGFCTPHPYGGQKPGGNGCTAYSAGDRRTRLGRSAAVGHRGLDGHAGGTFVALDGHHFVGAIQHT